MLESFDFPPPAFLRCLHDTYLEPTDVLVNLSPVDGLPVHCRVGGCANRIICCHPLFPLSRFAGLSREERPEGSLPAFAWSDVAKDTAGKLTVDPQKRDKLLPPQE